MFFLHGRRLAALLILASLAACNESRNTVSPRSLEASNAPSRGDVSLAASVATQSVLLARGTFSDPNDQNFNIKRRTDDWQVDIKAKPAFDLAVQTITFPSGSNSGWHSHPGPVFIQVVSGTLSFYESDDPTCSPIVRSAGQSYLDAGEHAHIARNESGASAQTVVTYFAPPGVALKIPASPPGNCAF
jgi:hypothetical protein